MSQPYTSKSNSLLGYPPDARLLIINADDLGIYHAVNTGILQSLRHGIVQSTSLMVTSPAALQAMQILRENPDISFSIHLTIICDMDTYLSGPLTAAEKVPSLITQDGYFYTLDHESKLLAQAKLDEVEVEFRTQIETVLNAGLKPTHLDWHCLHHGGRDDIFEMTLGLAREYGLALRVSHRALIEPLHQQGLPTAEYDLLDSFSLKLDGKSARYAQMLRELPAGLSEWAVHPSVGDAYSQTIDPGGWQVRRTDFEFLMSPEAREIIEQEGIILLSYRPLQKLWQNQ